MFKGPKGRCARAAGRRAEEGEGAEEGGGSRRLPRWRGAPWSYCVSIENLNYYYSAAG